MIRKVSEESMAAPSISYFDDLISRVQRRTGKTVVIGLGYVGLPLAMQHAKAGFKVRASVSDPYEEPERPEVPVETDALTVDESCQRILTTVSELEYLWGSSSDSGIPVDGRMSGDGAESMRTRHASLP